MKNLILILLSVFTFGCCDKEDDKTPLEQLPEATTTGKNTAGCLVNGQAFLPKGNNQFGPILSCFYQQDLDGYHFGLSIVEKESAENKSINISLNPQQLNENTTYNLVAISNGSSNYNSNFGQFIIVNNISSDIRYSTTATVIGEFKVTLLDTEKKIVSGTFWFDAVNTNGEKIEIREGRFDMHYIN